MRGFMLKMRRYNYTFLWDEVGARPCFRQFERTSGSRVILISYGKASLWVYPRGVRMGMITF